MCRTIIWFIVSVPVLSVLMALVEPRVSTSVRFLTTALASASCLAPYASMACTKVGMPVGIAEIAIAVPSSSTSSSSRPRTSPITTITRTASQAMTPRVLVSESSSRCSGERVRRTDVSMVAMRPIWVLIPVSVTTIVAVPRVTDVAWNNMETRSPRPISSSGSAVCCLATGWLSPVSAASCTSRVDDRRMRPSAGAMSPASTRTMSPGTSSVAGTE